MRNRTAAFVRMALGAAMIVSAGVAASAASAAERAIVVFDASGSMWGQIDGKPKIEIAREALGTVLPTLPKDIELGLMAYGHRDKGSCTDIELLVPPGADTAGAITGAVDGLRPRGMTPLSDSVRKAAEDLKYTEEKATVILITDGIETCEADPCALAGELEQNGVAFTAHVVGFGLSKEEGEQVACLADKTGGVYLEANDAGALGSAIAATVSRVAEAAPAPAPEAVAEPEPEPAPVEEPAKPAFTYRASAVLAEGGAPYVGSDLYWEIREPDVADQPAKVVEYSYGGTFERAVPPGDYVGLARLGNVTVEIPVTIKDGEVTEEDFVLNAGFLEVEARRNAGDADVEPGAAITASIGSTDETGYGRARFALPAGEIKLDVTLGNATVTETVPLKAGETVRRQIAVGTGVVLGGAVYSPGGPAVEGNEVFFAVRKPGKSIDGGTVEIAYAYGPGVPLDVTAGSYVLFARLGAAEAEVPFEVKAGETASPVVTLNAGVAAIEAGGAYRIDVASAKKDIQGRRTILGTSYDATGQFTLPAGDYVALVQDVADNYDQREVPFSVVAGERVEVKAGR